MSVGRERASSRARRFVVAGGVAGLGVALALAVLLDGGERGPRPVPAGPEDFSLVTLVGDPPAGPASDVLPLDRVEEPWTGDLGGMIERGFLRALVVYSRTNFFLDGPTPRGLSYEGLKAFEGQLNRELGGGRHVELLVVPVGRGEILSRLREGGGDLAAANLTITPAREERVDFSDPLLTDVSEVVVLGPAAPELGRLEDLAAERVHVRPSSSYWSSLERLNERLEGSGLEPVRLIAAPETLEDEDLLEMVNAGLVPMTVVDDHKAHLWERVFDHITVRDDLAVRSGGSIGWAFRESSPELQAAVNRFVATHREGTLSGNLAYRRYLESTQWVEDSLTPERLDRLRTQARLFQRYAERYDLDWLLVAAQAFQESRLDQDARSSAGAVGVMQLLPATAASPPIGISDIEDLEANIHAGVKYLRFLIDRYFDEEDIDRLDRHLLAMAAYNAGPTRVARLRRATAQAGLDPDRWFRNVERVVARQVGAETVRYVSNIFKYYLAYRSIADQLEEKAAARSSAGLR